MLYHLAQHFLQDLLFLNVLKFRCVVAIFFALTLSLALGVPLIKWLSVVQNGGQPIRLIGPESHILSKAGTPTMGGILIIVPMVASSLLFADLNNSYVWIILFVTLSYAILGFMDDYLKVRYRNSKGVSARIKLAVQFLVATVAAVMVSSISDNRLSTQLAVPFFKDLLLDLGWFYIPFICFVIAGASNAVNLTDGLDGLAIVPIMTVASYYIIISCMVGNANFASYLELYYVDGAVEIAVLCSALIGAGLGFLWFNAQPAQVFMGDVGSLALGGMLGTISIVTKHELILVIVGGIFVIEALSVIIQVISFKTRGKRVFKMAPVHHHFEKEGMPESKIVIRFWILSIVLALIGISTLKMR